MLINEVKIDLLSRVARPFCLKNPIFTTKNKMKKNTPSENSNEQKSFNAIEIPASGSLGLLALGAVGIKAWRKKREEVQSKQKTNPGNE